MIDFMILQTFSQILLSAALGMAIGAEREHRHKSAGLRTYTLVAIGSALFTILSLYGFSGTEAKGFDPSRIASQVVVGIGFIGTGIVILRENKIEGLTTAAGLWVTAAVGMAVGLGFYLIAIFTTILILAVFVALTHLKKEILFKDENKI